MASKDKIGTSGPDQVSKYFQSIPNAALWFIGIGILLLIFASDVNKLFGLLAIAAGAIWLFSYSRQKPSDGDIDSHIESCLSRAKARSIEKTNLDESQLVGDSVTITGPRFWDTAGAEFRFKKGNDGTLRFTPMNVTVLHLLQDQIVAYQCCMDLINAKFLNEGTDEYFYIDVVSIATKTTSKDVKQTVFGDLTLTEAEVFELTTSGGTSITMILRDPKLIQKMGGGNIPIHDAEKAIQVVRKMLREKKTNQQHR